VNPFFEETARREGFYSLELMRKVSEEGSVRRLGNGEVPEEWRKVFATAYDISPEWHVRMQAAFQKHTDNAVSKTVNFPAGATEEEVAKVYRLAYHSGCKGVTVYLHGSRDSQVLTVEKAQEENQTPEPSQRESNQIPPEMIPDSLSLRPRPRPEVTRGQTRKMITGCGALYVTINEDEEGIFEVFAQMGKSGGCAASQNETTGRMVSLALRSGIDVEAILHQLRGIRCPSPAWEKGGMVLSCSDAIARALEKYLEEYKGMVIPEKKRPVDGGMKACPECGGTLEPESGCLICRSCGFSRCS
jgi:ribonucleoside-diphosphate reductase alpha chain